MCDPISLTIATTAVTAAGQYVQGQAAYSQAKYQEAGAKANAALASDQAKQEIENTKLAAQRRYREASQLEGQQTAAMAANGIDLTYGSAAQVQRDSRMIANEDVSQIYREGANKTEGYLIDAYNSRLQASAAKSAAGMAKISTAIGIASTALGGATQISRMNAAAKFG